MHIEDPQDIRDGFFSVRTHLATLRILVHQQAPCSKILDTMTSLRKTLLHIDVTCDKCDARVRNALLALPGAELVELIRTPQQEAAVVFTTTQQLSSEQIENAITQQSAGTTHHYQVRWENAAL